MNKQRRQRKNKIEQRQKIVINAEKVIFVGSLKPRAKEKSIKTIAGAPAWSCTVSNLGSEDPSDVRFDHSGTMPEFEIVERDGDSFVKIPTMYRKVNSVVDDQITSFTISNRRCDDSYLAYPCFVKEDGVSIMPYILIGKYMSNLCDECVSKETLGQTPVASSQPIGNGRERARDRGIGYQLYDWMIHKLWQDLIICKMQTVDTNAGDGITTDALGIEWGHSGCFVDGLGFCNGTWLVCCKPSMYTDRPLSSLPHYSKLHYTPGATSGEITKLGFDERYPFANLPSCVKSNMDCDTDYDTYYCDGFCGGIRNHPVLCNVGYVRAVVGAFHCFAGRSWAVNDGVRLCYQPLSE